MLLLQPASAGKRDIGRTAGKLSENPAAERAHLRDSETGVERKERGG